MLAVVYELEEVRSFVGCEMLVQLSEYIERGQDKEAQDYPRCVLFLVAGWEECFQTAEPIPGV